ATIQLALVEVEFSEMATSKVQVDARRVQRRSANLLLACVALAVGTKPFLLVQIEVSPRVRRTMLRWLAFGAGCPSWAMEDIGEGGDLGYEKQDGLKPGLGKKRTRVPGFTALPSGLQVKDVNPGRNETSAAKLGDFVVFTWEGYTINYFGRPFETQTLQKMSGVEPNPVRFQVGDGTIIKGIDEGVRGMREGGVRQLYIPVELSYDEEKKLGPRPTTAGGNRALDFVMDNKGGLMDKTLLINVAVKRVYQK
ncbi:Peptidyl-prolyl cis-trans isomerase FKBP19, partial [Durusdinium trenchii]